MNTFALRRSAMACAALSIAFATTVASNDADACGGCFHPEETTPSPTTQSTVVTGHRMALSVSSRRTVLWDQVRYDGSPEEFAWVLPIKPGAYIEVASDAWFETLDAATTTQVSSPLLACPGGGSGFDGGSFGDGSGCDCGCGSDDEMGDGAAGDYASSGTGNTGNVSQPPVTVVHEGTVGPYETVTLHANEEGALTNWLTDNGFAIDSDIQPIIDAYADEEFDFIALRLAPNQGVQQMQPVRVVSPGAAPSLPLRMVAAGTGANVAITLFVIGEGRWQPQNFPSKVVDPDEISWDFTTGGSNYAELRAGVLDQEDGRTWLTPYARRGSLLSPVQVDDPSSQFPSSLEYATSDGSIAYTIARAYFQQALGTAVTPRGDYAGGCAVVAEEHALATGLVVDTCVPATGTGGAGVGGAGVGGAGVGGAGVGGAGVGGAGVGGAGGALDGTGGTGGVAEVCAEVGAGEVDARDFACGDFDDLAVAMTGMHPRDVWLTRLESDLPRAALATDLEMEPATPQLEVEHVHIATQATNNPCPLASAALRAPRRGPPMRGGARQPAILLGIACLVALAALRRSQRYAAAGAALAPS